MNTILSYHITISLTKYELSAHVLLSFLHKELLKVIFNTSYTLNSNHLDIKLK